MANKKKLAANARSKSKPSKAKAPPKTRAPAQFLWLVPIKVEHPNSNERSNFQLVVHASSPDEAMSRCTERLCELAATTHVFDEPTNIYSSGLVRLDGDFDTPLLVNMHIGKSAGWIENLLPAQGEHEATAFSPSPEAEAKPLLSFNNPSSNSDTSRRREDEN